MNGEMANGKKMRNGFKGFDDGAFFFFFLEVFTFFRGVLVLFWPLPSPFAFALPVVDCGIAMALLLSWERRVVALHAPYSVLTKDLKGDVLMCTLLPQDSWRELLRVIQSSGSTPHN
jgi:hypothetical protein